MGEANKQNSLANAQRKKSKIQSDFIRVIRIIIITAEAKEKESNAKERKILGELHTDKHLR